MKLCRAVFPNPRRRYPLPLFAEPQALAAQKAISELRIPKDVSTSLSEGVEILATSPAAFKAAKERFDKALLAGREDLWHKKDTDLSTRLAGHQAVMAAGYYARATDPLATEADPHRFVQQYYNSHVRSDLLIGEALKKSVYGEATQQSDELMTQLLETERFLFSDRRLCLVGGYRWLVGNLKLESERLGSVTVASEKELERLMDLPPIQAVGNFKLEDTAGTTMIVGPGWNPTDQYTDGYIERGTTNGVKVETEDFSKFRAGCHPNQRIKLLTCLPENFEPFCTKVSTRVIDEKGVFSVRYVIPPPPLTFWQKVEEALLQAWVFVVAGWIAFWVVDEEVLTLLGVFIARFEQRKILQQQAAEAQEPRIYIAKAKHTLSFAKN